MINKHNIEEYVADYLDNRLTNSQKQELEAYLAENQSIKEEFEGLKNIWEKIEKPVNQESPTPMDEAFYQLLNQEKTTSNKSKKTILLNWNVLKYAAAAAVLLGVFWVGRRTADKDFGDIRELATLRKEVQETKELVMLSMLKQESASERIKAVNFSYEMQHPDNQVVEALVKALNEDPNVNVRMAAAEAMSHFGQEKKVRDALIQSLLKQNEPTLQITIIDILANLNEKRALPQIQKLVQSPETERFVKRKAEESLRMLTL